MERQKQASPGTTVAVGLIAVAAGLYFMLASAGVLPPPGKANAPMWVAFFAGLVFFLAGVAVLVPVLAGQAGGKEGELPLSAPRWLRITQYLLVLTIFASFAVISSWIAFGPGPRSFSVSGPFISGNMAGETVGRTAFGISAAIMWLCTVALAVSGARKFFGAKKI